MSGKRITAVAVTYEDGSMQTWTGHGTAEQVRTPTEARGAPILRDSDLSYVQIVLQFDRVPTADLPTHGSPALAGGAQ